MVTASAPSKLIGNHTTVGVGARFLNQRLYLAKLKNILVCRKAIVLGASCIFQECTDINERVLLTIRYFYFEKLLQLQREKPTVGKGTERQ